MRKADRQSTAPFFSVIVHAPDGGREQADTLRTLQNQRCADWRPAESLEESTGEYVLMLPAGSKPHPDLLRRLRQAARKTGADVLYPDTDSTAPGPNTHWLKPDYAPDYLRCFNYIGGCFAFRREVARAAGIKADMRCHELVLRLTEQAARVAHVPGALCQVPRQTTAADAAAVQAQISRLGWAGTVQQSTKDCCRLRYAIPGHPLVSIVIPNKDHPEDLRRCVDSIREKSTWPDWEIVIVENNSTRPETFRCYSRLLADPRIRLVTWQGGFNYSAIVNRGAQYSRGEYILQLNNDTQVITPEWMEEMLMYAQRPDVGAVGAMLYYPDDTVQHAGVVLSLDSNAEHAFRYARRGEHGYMERMACVQNVSAVTGACLMTSRKAWERVGGMDEALRVTYNDVDLCLRLRAAGLQVIWTPHAELYHYESQSRGPDETPEKQARRIGERNLFLKRHGPTMRRGDPFYTPRVINPGSVHD